MGETLDQIGQCGQVGQLPQRPGHGPIRAQVAADGLTAGDGEEMLTQAGVQDFLWTASRLPSGTGDGSAHEPPHVTRSPTLVRAAATGPDGRVLDPCSELSAVR